MAITTAMTMLTHTETKEQGAGGGEVEELLRVHGLRASADLGINAAGTVRMEAGE